MALRCRPNELCVVERAGPFRGLVITVTRLVDDLEHPPAWEFVPRVFVPSGDEQTAFFDHVLRPIRPERDPAAIDTPADVGEVAWG